MVPGAVDMTSGPDPIDAFQRLSVKERNERLFQLLVEVGAKSIVVDGENGEIEGLVADRTVMLKYFKNRVWARETVSCAEAILARGGSFVDLGANIGLTTIPVARLPGVACIAVEAMPENARLLRLNLTRNGVAERVEVHNVAISPAAADVTLEIAPENKGDHRLRLPTTPAEGRYGEGRRQTVSVPGRPLGDVIDAAGLAGPVVVKMDIQGAEPFALDTGEALFRRADLLVTEYWPYGLLRLGQDPRTFLNRLAALYPWAAQLPEGAEPAALSFKPSAEVAQRLAGFAPDGGIDATDIVLARKERPF